MPAMWPTRANGVSFISDPVEQAKAVFTEEVDLLFNIATQNVQQFQANNRYQVVIGASNGKGMLAMNHRRKPLDVCGAPVLSPCD